MKKLVAPLLGLVLACGLFSGVANAQLIDTAGDSIANISNSTGGQTSARLLAITIINYFLYFLGFIATIMIIYGGFLYITSGGDDGQTGKAKKILMYAAIGIIIILISFALVNTIISAGLGAKV